MNNPFFLPQEATEVQRRDIMQRSYAASQAQGAIVTPETRAVYDRYVRGECTLQQAIDKAMSIYPLPEKRPQ
ncbi:hypothetical protein DNI29_23475 [Hymenobacter sediminis]|uniref:antitoxin VbhA family protein n=1 Tax=Hymenobacter sediminis TaxID=2218621 RepID=UPI000DA64DC2|nr:antitoxin VbhA family protein [Hymenobacter sediminis]RPD43581.1 hypothetical protein DNI29_23475 [Hymenobacter sediminis]